MDNLFQKMECPFPVGHQIKVTYKSLWCKVWFRWGSKKDVCKPASKRGFPAPVDDKPETLPPSNKKDASESKGAPSKGPGSAPENKKRNSYWSSSTIFRNEISAYPTPPQKNTSVEICCCKIFMIPLFWYGVKVRWTSWLAVKWSKLYFC